MQIPTIPNIFNWTEKMENLSYTLFLAKDPNTKNSWIEI